MTDTRIEAIARDRSADWQRLREFWVYFRENRGAVIGLAVLVLLALVAIFAGLIAPHDPVAQNQAVRLKPPAWFAEGDWRYLLGTDDLGRDVFSRILYGTRYSLTIGLIVVVLAAAVGITLGLATGFIGGALDAFLMRVMDVVLAFPSLLLALVLVTVLEPGLESAMIAAAVVNVPYFARITRSAVIGEKHRDYVIAARVAGASEFRLATRTVLPNCLAPVIVQAALTFSNAILDVAALGFLGMGARPPTPEWGTMLADAREFITSAPWVVTAPGVAILVTVLAINLMGDGLRDALDPKLKRS